MRTSLFACALLLSSACGSCEAHPLPPDKLNYVGLWLAQDRYFSIFAEGRLEYREKLSMGFHNRVSSGCEIGDTEITAMMTTWTIEQPPKVVDGAFTMVIDGIRYTHRGPPVTYGRSNDWPDGIE